VKGNNHHGTPLDCDTVARSFLCPTAWQALGNCLALSPQELRIVRLIFEHRTRRSMARELGISPHTVHSHFRRLYRKLGVADEPELILRVFGGCIQICPFAGDRAAPHGRTPE
jgi:DNA-binding CsgD family transcriptional regulator